MCFGCIAVAFTLTVHFAFVLHNFVRPFIFLRGEHHVRSPCSIHVCNERNTRSKHQYTTGTDMVETSNLNAETVSAYLTGAVFVI